MDNYRRLKENIRKAAGPASLTIYQGIVTDTDGILCSCIFGNIEVTDIRLRASLTERDRQMLVVPKIGSAVILGSLSGDLADLAVLQVDEIERIEINGGQLGGLINISELTDKINALIDMFNSHTHSLPTGTVAVAGNAGTMSNLSEVLVPEVRRKAEKFSKEDYEDNTIKH